VIDQADPQVDNVQEVFERNQSFARPGRDETARRQRLDSILRSRVEVLAKSYRLSEPQKKKLLVAGQGDIKRYFDSVEETWVKLDLAANDPIKTRETLTEIERLGRVYNSGMFKSGSIFAKTLSKTLSDEQTAKYKKEIQERHQHRFRATLSWVAGTLEQTMKLTANQRRRLEKLLIEETRAPEAFGSYDYYGLIFQAAKIPEAKLKPIFDDDQWQALTRQFQEVRGMENLLKIGGFLPVDGAAAERAATDDGEAFEEPRIFPIGR